VQRGYQRLVNSFRVLKQILLILLDYCPEERIAVRKRKKEAQIKRVTDQKSQRRGAD